MTSYDLLLKKARKEMPKIVFEKERFEIPKVKGHLQGNKTVISNFQQIASDLRREPEHLLKYLLRELATPGEIKHSGTIFGRKISATQINEKIKKYTHEFVLCSECGKPDTKIVKEGDFSHIKCQACGAKHRIRSKI